MTPSTSSVAQSGDARSVGERFAATPLPSSVCADQCASMRNYPAPRFGTNLMTVAEADEVLAPIVSNVAEHAFRAGFAAAEEALGAHGSEWLLDAIERAWAEYAADNALIAQTGQGR